MSIYVLGLGLILLGVLLFLIGRRRPRIGSVSATHGSIAIGGSSFGPVSNVSTAPDKSHGLGSHWITIAAIISELAGIAVTIWHATSSAAK
jgi:hypothetical protein